MKKAMRFAAAAVCLLFSITAAGCGSNGTDETVIDTLNYSDVSYDSDVNESGTVAENDTWELIWDADTKRVHFLEKATGNMWGNVPQEVCEVTLNEQGFPVMNHAQIESAIQVFYHNPANLAEESILSYNDAVRDGEVYAIKIDNGLRVVYDFYAYEIIVPVDYVIEGDRFTVTVDPTKIADNGEQYATGVGLAPFVCGVKNGAEDSWLFLPDGTGAIIEPNTTATVGDMGSAHVYGDDLAVQNYYYTSKLEQAYMPVFGAKKGDKAILGVIESGVESASINWNIGSENIGLSTVYATFAFRGYSLTTPPRGYSGTTKYIKLMADFINPTPLSVAYYPLNGEDASITGMAEVYRNYLIEKGNLQKSDQEEKSVAFKYMGGTEQPDFFLGLPTTKLFPLTTTEQAQLMTTELAETLGNDFYVDMFGYGTSGVDTGKYGGNFQTADALGGNKGMKQLSATMDELGISWYMDFDVVSFRKGSNGYNSGNHGARWHSQQTAYFQGINALTRKAKSDDRTYIMGRGALGDAVKKLTEKASNMELQGLSLDSLSHTIYSDYRTSEYSTANKMAEDVKAIIDNVKESGYTFLADAPNDYAAGRADAIIDAPLYSSLYDFTDYDVPFYQMVLRGYVPMNSVSINLCGDEADALLRCVRAGISPSYTLTYNYDNELITSVQSFIFGSSFEGNKERILESVDSVKNYLESIKGATIAEYENITDDVTVTTFSNGVYAVVNTGETAVSTAYGEVPADSWITGRVAQ